MQVLAVIRGSSSNKASVVGGVEESVIYVRFKAAASEVLILSFVLFF